MLGFCTDRSSRLHASIENLWEITRYIVWEFHHSTRIEPCKKSLGGLALHSIGKNMPRVPKCQFYPSLKMPRVAIHSRAFLPSLMHQRSGRTEKQPKSSMVFGLLVCQFLLVWKILSYPNLPIHPVLLIFFQLHGV